MAHITPRLILVVVLLWATFSDVGAIRRRRRWGCPAGTKTADRHDCDCSLHYDCSGNPLTRTRPKNYVGFKLLDLTRNEAAGDSRKKGVFLMGRRQRNKKPDKTCEIKCRGRARTLLGRYAQAGPVFNDENIAFGRQIAARLLFGAGQTTGSCCTVFLASKRACFPNGVRHWRTKKWQSAFKFWHYGVTSTVDTKTHNLFAVGTCNEAAPFANGLQPGAPVP